MKPDPTRVRRVCDKRAVVEGLHDVRDIEAEVAKEDAAYAAIADEFEPSFHDLFEDDEDDDLFEGDDPPDEGSSWYDDEGSWYDY